MKKQKQGLILFHIFETMITFTGLMKITGNAYGIPKIFQGINSTKYFAHILGKKGMYIKSCYGYMEKYHIIRYQEIQPFKKSWKCVFRDYLENIK